MRLWQLPGQDNQGQNSQVLRQFVIESMRAESELLNYAEFYTMQGNSDSPLEAIDIAGGATRSANSDYSAVQGTPAYASVTLKILGGKVQTDLAFERRGISIANERERQLRSFSKSLARFFTDQIINGSGTGNNVKGIATQLPAGRKFVFDTANGGQFPAGNSSTDRKQQAKFLEFLDEHVEEVNPTCIVANYKFIARLKSVAREFVTYTTIQNALGEEVRITQYAGIPLVNAGWNKDRSALVIPNDETEGTSNDCTSVYLVRFGEREDVSLATNVGLVVKDLGLVGVHYTTLVDLDTNVVILNDYAVARLAGIRL